MRQKPRGSIYSNRLHETWHRIPFEAHWRINRLKFVPFS